MKPRYSTMMAMCQIKLKQAQLHPASHEVMIFVSISQMIHENATILEILHFYKARVIFLF